jgi:hypothetical protein
MIEKAVRLCRTLAKYMGQAFALYRKHLPLTVLTAKVRQINNLAAVALFVPNT